MRSILLLALALCGFVVRNINGIPICIKSLSFPLKLVKGEYESVEEDPEISSELTRELLVAALKLLSKDRVSRSQIRPTPVRQVILGYKPEARSPVAVISSGPPCNRIADDVETAETIDEASNSRRAVGIATNPYTGQLHYVHYPTYVVG